MDRSPSNAEGMSPRAEQILESIVRAHIDTGEPVASLDLSRHRKSPTMLHQLSAASIRNVMAELAEMGYLSQQHASAGRVPTGKAYQHFVRGLGKSRIATAELDRIRGTLNQEQTIEGRVQATSRLLTGLTNGVGIAAAIPTGGQLIDKVELVALGGRRVLMVVVTSDGMVRDQVVALDQAVSPEDLTSIRNFFNAHYKGWAFGRIREDLRDRLTQASTAYHQMLSRLMLLYDGCLAAANPTAELHMGGAANLLGFEFGMEFGMTRSRMREMFRTLEEKKRIVQLLERFLEPPGDVMFQIGLGQEDPNLESLSLIGVSVRGPGGLTSRFAVLGPLRMDYEKALSAVRHVSRAFQTLQTLDEVN
jgi:heat-inducible transcriptional repressor